MKKFLLPLLIFTLLFSCSKKSIEQISQEQTQSQNPKVIASNSWTAAFCYLAGIDNVDFIAPANLSHPPEYEITVSDIQKIMESNYFVFASFDRMMSVLSDNLGTTQKVQITCNNSLNNIRTQVTKLVDICGDKEKSKLRMESLENSILQSQQLIEKSGLKDAKVYCNKNQIFLAQDLGFKIIATFGPAPVTSEQIAFAKNNDFDFIIDNVHNPVAKPLSEVCPNSKYIIWRNFPDTNDCANLEKVILDNVKNLELE